MNKSPAFNHRHKEKSYAAKIILAPLTLTEFNVDTSEKKSHYMLSAFLTTKKCFFAYVE
jgi:hypothetical protein